MEIDFSTLFIAWSSIFMILFSSANAYKHIIVENRTEITVNAFNNVINNVKKLLS